MKSSKVALNILSSVLSILFATLILIVVLRAGNAAYDIGYRIFTEPAMDRQPGRDITVRVTSHMSGTELGSLLEEKRLVDNGLLFAIQLKLSSYEGKLKAGTYTLNTSQTAEEMIQVLAGEEEEEKED